MDEIFAKIEGISVEEYRANASERERISRLAEKYIDSDSSRWPKIHFNWDLSVDGQRFSLDGAKKKEFSEWYPHGFLLGFVNLNEFDKKLCRYSRRDEGELWEVGCKDKLANLIIYLSEGKPISPPLVKPTEDHEVVFGGGHHRYAIAKEIKEKSIPIHIERECLEQIDKILTVDWCNA